MMKDIKSAISVNNVHKTFKLPLEQSSGIKQSLVNFAKRKKGYELQHVLKGISFDIKQGEFFGIVGRNGSGKSTLLKLLSGIYVPDSGEIHVSGSLTPFIELGVGFNMELTGRENVFLNGALLGFSADDMRSMYSDIVEFAELEKFMDQKLKNYSSGMQVRLAFSIAIRADTDILILDEVLAVGDESFQKKCYEYFGSLKANNKTVILVTHDMGSVEKYCTRALLLEQGEIKYIGNKSEAAHLYSKMFEDEEAKNNEDRNKEKFDTSKQVEGSQQTLENIEIIQDGNINKIIKTKQPFTLSFTFRSKERLENAILGFHVYNTQGVLMFAINTEERGIALSFAEGEVKRLNFSIDNIYTDDTYSVNVALVKKGETRYRYHAVDIFKFTIRGTKYLPLSATHPDIEVDISTQN